MDSDFAETSILRVVAIETIESLGRPNSGAAAQTQSDNLADILCAGHPNGPINLQTDKLSNGITKGLVNGHANSPRKGHVNAHFDTPMNGSTKEIINGHEDSHTYDMTCSTEDVAVLMLTSGSTGNAKAVCSTHRQIFAAMRGKLASMPLPRESALLNWIAVDHVASLVEIHLCAMFAGLDQIHVQAIEMLKNPLLFLRLLTKHRVSRTFAPNFFLHKLQSALDTASAQDTEGID